MKSVFTYSILQYKHSIALKEAINVGVLFAFPESQHLKLVHTTASRPKSIYTNFDTVLFNNLLKKTDLRLNNSAHELFTQQNLKRGIQDFIHTKVLREDATTLQFLEPVNVINAYKSEEDAIREFTKILLPGFEIAKTDIKRRSEDFVLKRYTNYIFERKPSLENRFIKNPIITANDIPIKFDLQWENGQINYVKAISFDLLDNGSINSKALNNFGALTALKDYVISRKLKIAFLIEPPKTENLFVSYKNAVHLLEKAEAKPELVTPDKIAGYSEQTINGLESHGSDDPIPF